MARGSARHGKLVLQSLNILTAQHNGCGWLHSLFVASVLSAGLHRAQCLSPHTLWLQHNSLLDADAAVSVAFNCAAYSISVNR